MNVTRLAVELMSRNKPDTKQLRGLVVNTAGVEGIRGGKSQAMTGASSGAIIGKTLSQIHSK